MCCHVIRQALSVRKGFVAKIAPIRLLARMNALMISQIGFLGKSFVAPPAFIGPFTGVGTIVQFQKVFSHKTSTTQTALMGLLTRVLGTLVYSQRVSLRIAFIAILARV